MNLSSGVHVIQKRDLLEMLKPFPDEAYIIVTVGRRHSELATDGAIDHCKQTPEGIEIVAYED